MSELPALRVTSSEARHLIEARVAKGRALQEGVEQAYPRGAAGHDEVHAEFVRWDRYNELLIRKIFEGEEAEERYDRSKPIIMVSNLYDGFRALNTRLSGALTELTAIIETLELLDVTETPVYVASSGSERDEYFAELCRRTGGRTDIVVASKDIGDTIGLTDTARSDAEDFLRAEGLVDFVAMGPQVRLTHVGRTRFEQGEAAGSPVSATSQTIIVMGDVSGTIQQAGTGSVQDVAVSTDDAFALARNWLDELLARSADGTMAFTSDLEGEARDHIDVLKAELSKPEPQKSVVRASIRSMGRMLEEAGGSLIATGLLQGVPIIVQALT